MTLIRSYVLGDGFLNVVRAAWWACAGSLLTAGYMLDGISEPGHHAGFILGGVALGLSFRKSRSSPRAGPGAFPAPPPGGLASGLYRSLFRAGACYRGPRRVLGRLGRPRSSNIRTRKAMRTIPQTRPAIRPG